MKTYLHTDNTCELILCCAGLDVNWLNALQPKNYTHDTVYTLLTSYYYQWRKCNDRNPITAVHLTALIQTSDTKLRRALAIMNKYWVGTKHS